jgi:Tat protein secretion system quality control protein TatD with DNase activity
LGKKLSFSLKKRIESKMGDRMGGREAKNSSLKKSKKNPGAPAAKVKKAAKTSEALNSGASTVPHPPGPGLYFDCGAALISRQFDRDRDRVLSRAVSEGVSGIISWFSDIEKLSQLIELSKSNPSLCYYLAGVHPDNVDRTNKKSHELWLEKVEDAARKQDCLGILTGLNLTREFGTHFAQEALLRSSCQLADKLMLPVILHVASDGTSLDRAIDVLRSEGWIKSQSNISTSDEQVSIIGDVEDVGHRRVLLHDAVTATAGNIDKIKLINESGIFCIISAAGLADTDDSVKDKARSVVQIISLDKILVCTDRYVFKI